MTARENTVRRALQIAAEMYADARRKSITALTLLGEDEDAILEAGRAADERWEAALPELRRKLEEAGLDLGTNEPPPEPGRPTDAVGTTRSRPVESIMPREAAILLMAHLEARGAVFSVSEDGFVFTDLNGMASLDREKAERLSVAVLSLSDEIRVLLNERAHAPLH